MIQRQELQLLPGTKKRLGVKVPGENKFLYVGSAILGAVLVATFVLIRYQASLQGQITRLNNQINSIESARDYKEEKDLLKIKDEILLATQLIDNHVYLSKSLNIVANLLQPQVRFKTLGFTMLGDKITIQGMAASHTTIARQIAAFLSGEGIKDISLSGIRTNPSGAVEFSLDILFERSNFLYLK